MKHNDCQYGIPFCEYNDTKANIESITGLSEGCIAYATDTNQLGIYTGATWTWIASSGGIMYHGEYESDPTGISPSSGDEYFYDLEKRMQVYIDGEWRELNGAMRFQFTSMKVTLSLLMIYITNSLMEYIIDLEMEYTLNRR